MTGVRAAATTILARDRGGLEVLFVTRHHAVDFVANAAVFPGGKVEPGDHDPGWRSQVTGWAETLGDQRPLRIAAIRECFEECGLLLGDPGRLPADRAELRHAVDRGGLGFLDLARQTGMRPDLTALVPLSRWLTPPVVPKRFDTFFFVARAPEGESASMDGRETVEVEWLSPARALDLAGQGERRIVFPTRMNLQVLARCDTVEAALAQAAAHPDAQVTPEVVTRGGDRFLRLDERAGYGPVEERLETH